MPTAPCAIYDTPTESYSLLTFISHSDNNVSLKYIVNYYLTNCTCFTTMFCQYSTILACSPSTMLGSCAVLDSG